MGNLNDGVVRFGIQSTGRIAREFAAGLQSVAGADVAAVGSRTREAAERFAKEIGAPRAHDSYEALANDPHVDVIYVATPAARHAQDALMCLEAGKAVLVEKPFATNALEAQRVIDAARQRGLFCMEAMWMRFIPAVQRALAKVREGSIGEPRTLLADFGHPWRFDAEDHRFDRNSGGAWLDRGVYGVSLAVQLFGEPCCVRASATTAPTGCDLQSSAVLRFDADRLAVITASLSGYTANEAVIAGSTGRLRLEETFIRPDTVAFKKAPATSGSSQQGSQGGLKEKLKRSPLLRSLKRMLPSETREAVPYAGNGFGHEAAEVVRCLRAGLTESPTMPWSETLTVMRISDEVRAAWLGAGDNS